MSFLGIGPVFRNWLVACSMTSHDHALCRVRSLSFSRSLTFFLSLYTRSVDRAIFCRYPTMRYTSSPGGITLFAWTLCSLLSSISFASATSNDTSAAARTRPISILMAESIVARGEGMGLKDGVPVVNYEHGTFQRALWNLYTDTKNATYLSWIKQGIDRVITADGGVIADYKLAEYQLDDVRVGESMIHLWSVNKEAKYKSAAGVLAAQFKTQPRTIEGAFWHKQVRT